MRLESIGKNIRKYRLMRKLRQEDLAEKADLNISRYESHRYAFEIHQYTQVIHP